MSYRLFLDDVRIPMNCASYMHRRIGADNTLYLEDWEIVRDFDAFTKIIHKRGLPEVISFDHDLADVHYNPETWTENFKYKEKTGADCAKWLVAWCDHYKHPIPHCLIHSMNPVGCENIKHILKSEQNTNNFSW